MTTYNQQIEEALLEDDEVYQLQQDQAWGVYDYGMAVWVDGILVEKEKKVEEIEQIYNERMDSFKAKMDLWKESAAKKHVNDIEFFKQHLHAYQLRVIDEEKANKAKKISSTIKLPTRSLTFKKQQPEILVNGKEVSKAKDDPSFVQFVKENSPDFIKEEVRWGDYKKILKQTNIDGKLFYVDDAGQPLEFIQLIERPEKCDWTLNKE
jgi:hypothetical protein